jgi:hypothetical protein
VEWNIGKGLNDVIQKEPIATRDIFYHAMMRSLGIEKGKPFKPDARQKKILTEAALVGEAMAKANSADRRFADVKYRAAAHWDFALQLDADDPENFWNLIDERASWFYEAVGAGPSMAPKHPGPSSAYLSAYKDKSGEWLDGGISYRLHVPPDPPVKLFWSVTLYDIDTRALILNDAKIADRSSRMDLKKNEDGSVDIYCGPNAPTGFEKNWIPTVPAEIGLPISVSTNQLKLILIVHGRCLISNRYSRVDKCCHCRKQVVNEK